MSERNKSKLLKSNYGKFEPQNIGFFVDLAWRRCWIRVIARAWEYQINHPYKAKKIELGKKLKKHNAEDKWYSDLLSQDIKRTKRSLLEQGMIYLASEEAEKNNWDKWIFTDVVVRTRSQSINLYIENKYRKKNSQNDLLNEKIGSWIMKKVGLPLGKSYCPEREVRLEDEEKYFLICFPNSESDLNNRNNTSHDKDELVLRDTANILFSNVPDRSDYNANSDQNSQENNVSHASDVKAVGHFLVLTLPPCPENNAATLKALSDYWSTNYMYPIS